MEREVSDLGSEGGNWMVTERCPHAPSAHDVLDHALNGLRF